MRFKDESTLNAFLADEPFYENNDCFCLGNTLTEAGSIVNEIVKNGGANNSEREGVVCGNG